MTRDPDEFVTIEEAYREMQAADPSLPPLTDELVRQIEDVVVLERGAEQDPPRRVPARKPRPQPVPVRSPAPRPQMRRGPRGRRGR